MLKLIFSYIFFIVFSLPVSAENSFITKIESLAERGFADAQYQLGRMYDSGLGVAVNKKEAFKWYSLSAEQGSIEAQYNLGLAYRFGVGVEQNFTKSLKWYKESASKGHSGAQYNLNLLFEEGLATRKDISDAIKWYRFGR